MKLTTANCDFSANAGCFLDSTSALYIFTPLFAPVALQLGNRGAYLVQRMQDKLVEHRQYIRDNGVDLPEIRNWKWDEGLSTVE